MTRALSTPLLLLLVSACATPVASQRAPAPEAAPVAASSASVRDTPSQPEQEASEGPAPACEALEVAPPEEACRGLPADHGLRAEQPLEWAGMGTFRGLPWHLVCPSGADIELGGSKGSMPAVVASQSPRGGFGAMFPEANLRDMLDTWTVSCPGQPPLRLFTNAYRCGNPCPPQGLRRLPAPVQEVLEAGLALMKEKRWKEARERFEAAAALAPSLERGHALVAATSYVMEDWPAAIRALEAALAINPDEPNKTLRLAMARQRAGDKEALPSTVEALLSRLPVEHPLRPELLCRKAYHLFESHRPEAADVARQACEAGEKECCDLKP